MSSDTEVIGIYPNTLDFQSDYVPFISFRNQQQKDAGESYIIKEAYDLFTNILKISSSTLPTQIAYSKLITEKDFQSKSIEYFYETLFYDLGGRKSDGKLEIKTKWSVTFDIKCAPIRIHSQTTGKFLRRRYGTIDINGSPVFYYIYFELQEILDVIKNLPTS